MKYFLAFALALVVTTLFAYSQTRDSPKGKIKGTVTDKDGNLVTAATVYLVPEAISFEELSPRSAKTDSNGEFDFHGVFQLGTYKLYSRKNADGYPDSSDSFYADPKAEVPKAELTEDHPSVTVTVKLGEKAGVLAGRVIDADTGATLKAKLVFMDEDGHDHSVFVNGKYRALLPAEKDVTLMVIVMSPDYHAQLPTAALRLDAGQEMQMDIPLAKQ